MEHLDEKISDECKRNIEESLKYLNSVACKSYSMWRDTGTTSTPMTLDQIKASAKAGSKILRKHGGEILRQLCESRSQRINEFLESGKS